MTSQSLLRLLGVILTGIFLFSMVIGSIGFTQLDPLMVVQSPTPVILRPSRTLFPTQMPGTDTPQPTESEPVIQPTITKTNTATPASPLVVKCVYPDGWHPYIFRDDDTIYALALKANINTRFLLQANCVGSTEDIQSGTVLYLPPDTFATATPQPYVCGPPAVWRIVTVNRGETLYGLAVRYGTTIGELMKANCINSYTLYAGQPLFVPPYIVVPPTPVWTPWPISTPTPLPPSPTVTMIPAITPTSTAQPTVAPSITVNPTVSLTPVPTGTPTPVLPTPTSVIYANPHVITDFITHVDAHTYNNTVTYPNAHNYPYTLTHSHCNVNANTNMDTNDFHDCILVHC